MKKRFTDEQIVKLIKEHEAGKSATDIAREYNISQATFYSWQKKYSGMEVSDVKRLKELEAENRRLKEMVADLSLDNKVLKDIVSKN